MKRWVLIAAVSSPIQVEGESLTDQIRRLRAACAKLGGTIVDEIVIEGFRRSFIDWHEMKDEAAADGEYGFHKIEGHWKARDFDVMAAIDATRLWRTDALTVYGMARIYQAGGKLFTIRDGMIEDANRSMFSMMAGFQTQKEIESLGARWKTGMRGRIKRGLPAILLPFCYKYERNDKGEAVRVVLDQNWRYALDKIAELILSDVSYMALGAELYNRFGIVGPSGEPFSPSKFGNAFWSPMFWGHAAMGYTHLPANKRRGNWVFGPSEDLPEGVEIAYNKYEPPYPEPILSELISEIKRRHYDVIGRRPKDNIHRFTGLLQCGICGSPLSKDLRVDKYRNRVTSYRCRYELCIKAGQHRYGTPNERVKSVAIEEIQSVMERIVAMALDGEPITQDGAATDPISTLEKEAERLEKRIDRIIEDKLNAAPALGARYDVKLNELSGQLQHVQQEIVSARARTVDAERRKLSQQAAATQIASLGDGFWQLPEPQINRLLHLLFGEYRLIMEAGHITGIGLRINLRAKK